MSKAASSNGKCRASPTWNVTRSGQPAARRQIRGRIDEAGAQVDACHLTAEGGGEIARRAANAAAKIQHAGRWLEPSGAGQFGGGEDAAAMELVEWGELSDGQRLTFGRDRRERRLDPVDEARGAIVLAHLGGGIGHNGSPGMMVNRSVGPS